MLAATAALFLVLHQPDSSPWPSEPAPPVAMPWSAQDRAQCVKVPTRDCILTWATVEARKGAGRINSLPIIAAVWPKPELVGEAIVAARQISDSDLRAANFAGIAASLAQHGMSKEALDATKEISSRARRAGAQYLVSNELARAGELDRALEIALKIDDAGQRSWALARIITAQAKAGSIIKGLDAARQIEDRPREAAPHERNALVWISSALAKTGRADEAVEFAAKIGRPGHRTWALAEIALAASRPDLFTDALVTARAMDDQYLRGNALGHVARFLAKAGRFDEAFAVLDEIEVVKLRDSPRASLALALGKAGLMDRALVAARNVNARYRPGALVALADTAAVPGFGQDIIQEALGFRGSGRDETLRGIAVAFAKRGLLDLATTAAKKIGYADRRADTLAAVAAIGKRPELIAEALATAQASRTGQLGDKALKRIAMSQTALGLNSQALVTVSEMASSGWRADTLTAIALLLSQESAKPEASDRLLDVDVSLPMPR